MTDIDLRGFMSFLLPVITQYMQSAMEVEHAANELAERYEEINLLYTISEILGRTVHLFLTVKVKENWSDTREFYAGVGLDFDV